MKKKTLIRKIKCSNDIVSWQLWILTSEHCAFQATLCHVFHIEQKNVALYSGCRCVVIIRNKCDFFFNVGKS